MDGSDYEPFPFRNSTAAQRGYVEVGETSDDEGTSMTAGNASDSSFLNAAIAAHMNDVSPSISLKANAFKDIEYLRAFEDAVNSF